MEVDVGTMRHPVMFKSQRDQVDINGEVGGGACLACRHAGLTPAGWRQQRSSALAHGEGGGTYDGAGAQGVVSGEVARSSGGGRGL